MLSYFITIAKWLVTIVGLLAISLVTADTLDEFFKADSCFDSGGVYVADLSVCFNKAAGSGGLVPDTGNMLYLLIGSLLIYSIMFFLLKRLFSMMGDGKA